MDFDCGQLVSLQLDFIHKRRVQCSRRMKLFVEGTRGSYTVIISRLTRICDNRLTTCYYDYDNGAMIYST